MKLQIVGEYVVLAAADRVPRRNFSSNGGVSGYFEVRGHSDSGRYDIVVVGAVFSAENEGEMKKVLAAALQCFSEIAADEGLAADKSLSLARIEAFLGEGQQNKVDLLDDSRHSFLVDGNLPERASLIWNAALVAHSDPTPNGAAWIGGR